MNKTILIAAVVAVVCGLGGGFVAYKVAPQLGGDFAGGVAPSQLVTGSASGGLTGNGYVAPVGSLSSAAVNGLSIGGNDQYHGLTAYITASGTPASVVTLGPFGTTTSSATTSINLTETAGLSIGAICSGSSATTTVVVSSCQIGTTDGATGTAIVAYTNLTGANLSVPTSTRLNVTFDQLPY